MLKVSFFLCRRKTDKQTNEARGPRVKKGKFSHIFHEILKTVAYEQEVFSGENVLKAKINMKLQK